MNLKALFIFAATLCVGLAPLTARADYWEHNGSLMYMAESDAGLYIDYDTPRRGLAALGVREGTRLFQGHFNGGNSVVGTAVVFKRNCQPADYEVRGSFTNNGNTLRLVGYAPIRGAGNSCRVVGYDVNRNSVLIFHFRYPGGH